MAAQRIDSGRNPEESTQPVIFKETAGMSMQDEEGRSEDSKMERRGCVCRALLFLNTSGK